MCVLIHDHRANRYRRVEVETCAVQGEGCVCVESSRKLKDNLSTETVVQPECTTTTRTTSTTTSASTTTLSTSTSTTSSTTLTSTTTTINPFSCSAMNFKQGGCDAGAMLLTPLPSAVPCVCFGLPTNTTTTTTTLNPNPPCNNGAGGTYICNLGGIGMTNTEHAQAACESHYGVGSCNTGVCGSFSYWYSSLDASCDNNKADGSYEFIYANAGYTTCYGSEALCCNRECINAGYTNDGDNDCGDNSDESVPPFSACATSTTFVNDASVAGNSLFVRQKSSSSPWSLTLSNLGGDVGAVGPVNVLTKAPVRVSCECWDPAVGTGPTCSEHNNAETCNGRGVAQKDGTCVCNYPSYGTGVTNCSTYSNAETCNGNGIAQPNGNCECYSSAIGVGPTCNEYTDGTTCNGKGTAISGYINNITTQRFQAHGTCACWSSAVGTGPSCSEYTDGTTCNGNGTALVDGTCSCWSSSVGTGPTCIEVTDDTSCNGNGKVAVDGSCTCWSSEVGIGASCSEYTDETTCNGNGKAQYDGSCICTDPAVGTGPTCIEFNNEDTCSGQGIADAVGSCDCFSPALGISSDCSPAISNGVSCSGAGTAQKLQWNHDRVTPAPPVTTTNVTFGATFDGTSAKFEVCAPCTMSAKVGFGGPVTSVLVGPMHTFNGYESNL